MLTNVFEAVRCLFAPPSSVRMLDRAPLPAKILKWHSEKRTLIQIRLHSIGRQLLWRRIWISEKRTLIQIRLHSNWRPI